MVKHLSFASNADAYTHNRIKIKVWSRLIAQYEIVVNDNKRIMKL